MHTHTRALAHARMVRKHITWQECEKPTTPSQVKSYFDACKDFLLSTENEETEEEFGRSTIPHYMTSKKIGNIGIQKVLADANNTFDCFICNKTTRVGNGNVVTANPFTRSYCMLLCAPCHSKQLAREGE